MSADPPTGGEAPKSVDRALMRDLVFVGASAAVTSVARLAQDAAIAWRASDIQHSRPATRVLCGCRAAACSCAQEAARRYWPSLSASVVVGWRGTADALRAAMRREVAEQARTFEHVGLRCSRELVACAG